MTNDETGEVWPITGCPWAQVDRAVLEWFRVYAFWQKGMLLVAGGLLDQPAKYVEVMEYLDGLMARKDRRDADQRGTARHPAVS